MYAGIINCINSIKPIKESFEEDDKLMIEFEEEDFILYDEEIINDMLAQYKEIVEPKIYFHNKNKHKRAYIKML